MSRPFDFDGCEVVRHLHSGPVSDSFEAIQKHLGRKVMIKALGSGILPSSPFAATIEREARLLADLNHPNILEVYDFVRDRSRMWTVLEWVDGFTVRELLAHRAPLSVPAALAVAIEVLRALDHAHARGIVHRDLQPGNILVSRSGQVKLVNFTVAVDERMPTAPELLEGSPGGESAGYMSPEQILGEPADPRSDLFSLGLVLYEMLSGEKAFPPDPSRSPAQRIRHERPEPLSHKVPKLPQAIERTLSRCLEKLPFDRFSSAQEVLGQLLSAARELGLGSAQNVLLAELAELKLANPVATLQSSEVRKGPRVKASRATLSHPLAGLLVSSLLVVSGGAWFLAAKGKAEPTMQPEQGALPPVTQDAAQLRVVATPWARVFVDGVEIDTTPIARPISLRSGVRYVRLEHPSAPIEHRTLRLSPGESALLEVEMLVPKPVEPPPQAPAPVDTTP